METKRKLYKVLICIFTMSTVLTANLHGIQDHGDYDLQAFINGEINAGKTNIVVPAGRYWVTPNGTNNYHLRFANLDGITIDATGVEMICKETVQALVIYNCTNFTIKGLTIDYDPLPFTQGRITWISSDKRTINVDILDGYSTTVNWNKLEIYDPVTAELSASTYYNVTYTVNKSARTMVITKPSNYSTADSHEEVGDIIVMDSYGTRNVGHAILPNKCTNLVLENVTLYAGTTFGFFEQDCDGSQYINCSVDRRPLSDEIVPQRTVQRMRSNNADSFHSKRAISGPKYIGCTTRYNGDDGIAINGDYHLVMATSGNQLTVLGKAGNEPNLNVGDVVELVSYTGERIEDATITNKTIGRTLNTTERNFLQAQGFKGTSQYIHNTSNKMYDITIDRSVSLPMGSLIASSSRLGNGFEIKNCTVGPNRSRGILVKASDGIIDNNTCIGTWKIAIKVAPEYVWLEAGSSNNLSITNNTISNCRESSIAVYAVGGNDNIAPIGGHNNIAITGNSISGSLNPGIAVTSTKDLLLNNNTISSPNNSYYVPWLSPDFGHSEDPSRTIYLENVSEIEPATESLEVQLLFNEVSGAPINTGENTQVSAVHNGSATFNPGVNDLDKGNVLYVNSSNNGEVLLKEGSNNYTGPTGGQARTFAFWVNLDAMNFQTMLYSGGGSGDIFNVQMENTGIMRVYDGNNNYVKMSDLTLTAGNWHHVALVVPQSGGIHDIEFYLDGIASVESNIGSNAAINTGANIFKLFPNFSGHISDFRYYNYALSPGEISDILTGGNLEVQLQFNEATGVPINTGNNTQITAEHNGTATFNPGVNDPEKGSVLYVNSSNNGEVLLKEGSSNYPGPTGGQARTFTYWVKLDAMNFQTMLYSGGGSGDIFNVQMENTGIMRVYDGNNNYVKMSDLTLTAGNWHHVALVVPQSGGIHDIEFYLDGNPSNETNVGSNAAINTGANIFKLFPNFSGHVSDFRYYNYALNASEISDVFSGADNPETTITVRARRTNDTSDDLELWLDDNPVSTWTVTGTSYVDYTFSTIYNNENIKIYFPDNIGDMRIDYIQVGSNIYQAEDQAINTSVWQDGSCGGSFNELMQCTGYIDFGNNLKSANTNVIEFSNIDNSLDNTITIYPNPVNDFVNIEFSNNTTQKTVSMVDLQGRVVFKEDTAESGLQITTSGIPKGVYLVVVKSLKTADIQKIVIE